MAELLRDPRLWTARDLARTPTVATGHAALDAQLPGGGWPLGALTELFCARPGIGELALLMPALAQLSARGRRIALIQAPYRACAPGWTHGGVRLEHLLLVEAPRAADALWAAEQVLRSAAFGAALLWPRVLTEKDLRRLQLAAEQGGALAFLFRPPASARQSSPAALRLALAPRALLSGTGLRVDIVKSRGGQPRALQLDLPGRSKKAPVVPNHALVMPLPAAPAARCTG